MDSDDLREFIPRNRQGIQRWLWRQKFERRYGEYAGYLGDGNTLNFVWGLAGGGSEHLVRLLSQPGIMVRCHKGILTRFNPPLQLNDRKDRLGIPYSKDLSGDHPLIRVVRMLAEYDNEWTLQHHNHPKVDRLESLPCVIGESRALLASEALLRALGSKALVYVGDPVRAVDALFRRRGMADNYLLNEGRYMLAPLFLSRFLKRDFKAVLAVYQRIRGLRSQRQKQIAFRVLVAGMLEHMLRMLAVRYPQQVILVEYRKLKNNPYHLEDVLIRLLGEPGIGIGRALTITSTFMPSDQSGLVWNEMWPEQAAFPRFLKPAEVDLCRELLIQAGLSFDSGAEASPAEMPQLKLKAV